MKGIIAQIAYGVVEEIFKRFVSSTSGRNQAEVLDTNLVFKNT